MNWAHWFKAWVSHGLEPAAFWRATPREAVLAVEAAGDRDWHHARHAQGVAYTLAQLIATGHHQPRKMPRFDKVFPDRKTAAVAVQAPSEAARNLELWMHAIAAFNSKGIRPQ